MKNKSGQIERPTPETDASIIQRRHIHKSDGSVQLVELIDAEFARRLERERDEAQEMAQQLVHIASHCLGWHDNSNPETITEAIKRWNASTKK